MNLAIFNLKKHYYFQLSFKITIFSILEMEIHYLVLICLSVTCSFISIALGCVHLLYVLKYISNEQIQSDLYWIVFMCPVISLCGSIGMILPRSAIFLYAVALV